MRPLLPRPVPASRCAPVRHASSPRSRLNRTCRSRLHTPAGTADRPCQDQGPGGGHADPHAIGLAAPWADSESATRCSGSTARRAGCSQPLQRCSAACREVVISDGQTIVGDIAHRWSTTTKSVLCDVVLELVASLGLRPVKRKKSLTSQEAVDDVAFRVNFTPHLTVIRLERTGPPTRGLALPGPTRAHSVAGLPELPPGADPALDVVRTVRKLLGVVADQHRSGCPRNRGHPRSV